MTTFLFLLLLVSPAPQSNPEIQTVSDPVAATEAYLQTVPPEKRAKSDAYFEGGYWLSLWSALYTAAVLLLLLATGFSARMRDWAARITKRRPLQVILYWIGFTLITAVAALPLSIYSDYVREHQYGLSNQTFGAWSGDLLKGLLVNLILGTLLVVVLYAVFRRTERTWWLWGALVYVAFTMFAAAIAPVYIAPLFNKYTPLKDPRIAGPILAMAHANGAHSDTVWVVDASRQSTRISANVSGMLGSERITLNDNLLNRGTLPEIKAVMGHEIGHYALNHVYELVLTLGVVIVIVFAVVKWLFDWTIRRRGEKWGIGGISDVASLPLLLLLFTVVFYLLTPLTNNIIRVQEAEADIFGLNAAREPDGFATIALKLSEYRKLAPGPLEEMIFFNHPSGRSRILMAMRWKEAQAATTP